ncbi:MAG: hypothetical protein ACLQVD_13955 [Capsulimonadaceae bacterium]
MKKKRAKPRAFDPAGKNILDLDPLGLVKWLGFAVSKVQVLNCDLTARLSADRLILLVEEEWILNIELQAQYDPEIQARLLAYMGLIRRKYGKPVKTIVILLCLEADGEAFWPPVLEWDGLRFEFRVIRIWNEPPEPFFAGSPALLALLPLADVTEEDLPVYLSRIYDAVTAS